MAEFKQRIEVTLDQRRVDRMDEYRARFRPPLSRTEAIRNMIDATCDAEGIYLEAAAAETSDKPNLRAVS